MSIDPQLPVPTLSRRSERVRWAREQQTMPMSQRELARRIDVSPRTVQLMENEDGGSKRSRYLDKVAQVLNVSFKWLMDGEGHPFEREDSGLIRWLAVVDAAAKQTLVERKPVPVWLMGDLGEDAFLFQVQDEAMAPVMPRGSWVVCDPALQPVPGSVVLLRNSRDAPAFPTLRTWRDRDISVELVPDNNDYASIHMGKADAELVVVTASFLAL